MARSIVARIESLEAAAQAERDAAFKALLDWTYTQDDDAGRDALYRYVFCQPVDNDDAATAAARAGWVAEIGLWEPDKDIPLQNALLAKCPKDLAKRVVAAFPDMFRLMEDT